MLDIAVLEGPGDLLVAQLDLLQVIVLFLGGVLDVVHFRSDIHHLDVLEQSAVALDFVAIVVNAIPLELGTLKGLAHGHSLEQVDRGGIDLLGEHKRRVNPCACQLA
ncbi:hypothetical protein D3C87_1896240 [compost metagenome]